MAVQQNKPTRSKRGMRRSHDALTTATLSVDKVSGETHLRHHITADGYYRGRKVIAQVIWQYLETSNPCVRCHGWGFRSLRDSACSIAGTGLRPYA